MNASYSEILACALGDATPDVAARVRVAIQSDPECARIFEQCRLTVSSASQEAKRMNGTFEKAMAASMKALKAEAPQAAVAERPRTVRVFSAWGSLAAAACAVIAWGIFASESQPGRNWTTSVPELTVATTSVVSFSGADAESGDDSNRFGTLALGVSAVESGGTVSIEEGVSAETLRIEKPVRLIAASGPVVIGIRN